MKFLLRSVNVSYFCCVNCKEPVKSLKGVHTIWTAVVEMGQEELRDEAVSKLNL